MLAQLLFSKIPHSQSKFTLQTENIAEHILPHNSKWLKCHMQEQKKVTSAAAWEEKAGMLGGLLEKARGEEERQALEQAEFDRRSTMLAEKLRNEEQQLLEELSKRMARFWFSLRSAV